MQADKPALDAYVSVKHVYAMCIAKTDQAAQLRSSCYGYTSAQPYRRILIYTLIPFNLKSTIHKLSAENRVYANCIYKSIMLKIVCWLTTW